MDLCVDKVGLDRWRYSMYLDAERVERLQPGGDRLHHNFTIDPVSGLPLLPILGLRGDF
jgi:hypothetical protein